MAWDSPATLALLGASAGFLDPRGGTSAGFHNALQGMQAGNQIQQQRLSNDELKNKLAKKMEIENMLKQLSAQHGGDMVGMSKSLTGSGYPELIKLGIDLAKAKTVRSYIKGEGPDGKPTYYAGYNTGELSPTGVTPSEKLMQINRGSQIDLANPYTGDAQKSLGVGISPGQSAQLAQSQNQFNMSHALAQQNSATQRYQAMQPKFVDGAFVYPPNEQNPQGSMVKTDLFAPPKGSDSEKSRMSERVANTLGDDTEALIRKATGSTVGSIVDSGLSMFGATTSGAEANATLRLRSATLAGNMPRFEGPQSDADREFYLEMAGDLANPSKTTTEKLAALKELRRVHKLADNNGGVIKDSIAPSGNNGSYRGFSSREIP